MREFPKWFVTWAWSKDKITHGSLFSHCENLSISPQKMGNWISFKLSYQSILLSAYISDGPMFFIGINITSVDEDFLCIADSCFLCQMQSRGRIFKEISSLCGLLSNFFWRKWVCAWRKRENDNNLMFNEISNIN